MSENNSSATITATISEGELFREFLRFGYGHFDPFKGTLTKTTSLRDLVADGGGVDVLWYAMERWAKQLEASANPAFDMDEMVEELSCRLDNVKQVRSWFAELQAYRIVHDEAHDETRYTPRPASWHGSSEYEL